MNNLENFIIHINFSCSTNPGIVTNKNKSIRYFNSYSEAKEYFNNANILGMLSYEIKQVKYIKLSDYYDKLPSHE